MANPITQIIITAVDKTKAAFASAKGGLDSIGNTAASMRDMLANLFVGLSVVGFIGAMRRSIDSMDDASKSARAAGTSVEKFSALTYAAGQSGAGPDVLKKSLIGLSTSLDDAKDGTGLAAEAFQRLNIDPKQFKDPADALLVLADRFSSMPDGIDKTALAAAIFGKRIGPDLIPLLNEGSDGITRMTDQAAQLGLVLKNETTVAAEEFNDSLDRLKESGNGIGITIASKILPSLSQYASALDDVLRNGSALDRIKFFSVGYITPEVLARIAKANQTIRKESSDTTRALGENHKQEAAEFKRAVDEQISDAKRLQTALQTAFSASLKAEEEYRKDAKELREKAANMASSGDKSQESIRADATLAAMKLERVKANGAPDEIRDQADAVQELASNLEDAEYKTWLLQRAMLGKAAAAEKSADEEARLSTGLAEQLNANEARLEEVNTSKDEINNNPLSVQVAPNAQIKVLIDDLNTINSLIGQINTAKIAPGGGAAARANSMSEALSTAALQHGRRG